MIRKLTRVNPLRSVAALMLAAACFTTSTVPVAAGDLNQVVSADEAIAPAGELIEFRSGHADIGPLMAPKKDASDVPFSTYIRDDSSAPPVRRAIRGGGQRQTNPARIRRLCIHRRGARVIGMGCPAGGTGWCAVGGVEYPIASFCGGDHRRDNHELYWA